MNKLRLIPLILVCAATLPLAAQQKKSTGNSQAASLQKQVKSLTQERDTLKQEQAELYRQIDEANAQKEQALYERNQLEATLRENQTGGETLLRDIQQTRRNLDSANSRVESLEEELESLRMKVDDGTTAYDGAFVKFRQDIIPAKCLNLRRMTPKVKKARGVVVVNCLINELGEPVDVKLIQGIPGEGEWVEKANEACVEAAKRLVFQPATTLDGSARLKVWQGVGFLLN